VRGRRGRDAGTVVRGRAGLVCLQGLETRYTLRRDGCALASVYFVRPLVRLPSPRVRVRVP
jgi:hypothetical protein